MDYYFFALWVNLMIFVLVRIIRAHYVLRKRLKDLQVNRL